MPPKKGQRPTLNNQCTKIKKNGERCNNNSMTGLDVCSAPGHGGTLPSARAKSARVKTENALVRAGYGNATVVTEHEGANATTGYLWELRRTAGKIVFVEEKLADMRDEDIIWGRTLEESKDAHGGWSPQGGFQDDSYQLTRDEARLNLWVQIGLKERQHYAALLKLGLAAGFEERRLRLEEQLVLQLNLAITNILMRFDVDPEDPDNRAIIREELMAVEDVAVVHTLG